MRFKRNQVDEAIALVLEGQKKASAQLRTRIKRLLEADREEPIHSDDTEAGGAHSAFFSGAAPGKGSEVQYTRYDAFAVLMGVRLSDQGWPQGKVVRVLRRVRPQLEEEHAQILKQDPAKLFDPEAHRANALPGMPAWGSNDPLLLQIRSHENWNGGTTRLPDVATSRPPVAFRNGPVTIFELTQPAWQLERALRETAPRRRGPRASAPVRSSGD